MAAPSLTTFWQMSMHFATVFGRRAHQTLLFDGLVRFVDECRGCVADFASRRVEAREVGAHVLVVDEGLHNVFTGVFHGVFSYLGMYSCLK